ncbi:Uncharacterised protein [uncultured archaeon]|nr:Uncharacterised protein [uncultured archaeon]
MAAISFHAYNDSSTLSTFMSWASAVSAFMSETAGWIQTTDTGQVMWSGMSLTAVSVSGSNATYTYSNLVGQPLYVGRSLTITGMTNSANNGVFNITAVGSGTFTVTNASAVAESSSSGIVTGISTIPGSNAYVYEIWQPNDGLTNFYLYIGYGNVNQSNNPAIWISIATQTTGAGTLLGTILGPYYMPQSTPTVGGASNLYECRLSGQPGRISVLLWRGYNCGLTFGVERSINSSGTYTGNYVTLIMGGFINGSISFYQQTLMLSPVGQLCPYQSTPNGFSQGGLAVRVPGACNSSYASQFNGQNGFDTYAPWIGYYDNNGTNYGVSNQSYFSEGQILSVTLYGQTQTYICTKTSSLNSCGPAGNNNYTLLVKWD